MLANGPNDKWVQRRAFPYFSEIEQVGTSWESGTQWVLSLAGVRTGRDTNRLFSSGASLLRTNGEDLTPDIFA
jgi:hypothetical protein